MEFREVDKSEIYDNYNHHYRDNAIYYDIRDGDKSLCKYGFVPYSHGVAEVFWILDSFNKNVISKKLFSALFKHSFALGYKVLFTWTRCEKLIKVFEYYKRVGIEEVPPPAWDSDPTKTWFMKRI
jgi:hypothetical protein